MAGRNSQILGQLGPIVRLLLINATQGVLKAANGIENRVYRSVHFKAMTGSGQKRSFKQVELARDVRFFQQAIAKTAQLVLPESGRARPPMR